MSELERLKAENVKLRQENRLLRGGRIAKTTGTGIIYHLDYLRIVRAPQEPGPPR